MSIFLGALRNVFTSGAIVISVSGTVMFFLFLLFFVDGQLCFQLITQ